MNIYTVKSTDIVHNTSVDLITRWFAREVHIVQYDNSQPIVAVELFKNSERFVLPDGYEANLRFGKKDRTFIYKPVLGCNQGRDTVYFAVDEQMSMFYGKVNPIIEFTYNGAVVGSSSIPFVIDKNPIQIGDVESKSDYPAIVERISAAETAAADAKKAVNAEAAERAAGDAKTLSDAKAYTDSSTSGLVSDSTTIKSNITTLQSDVASLKTDNIQNKTNISNKQDTLVSGTNIKTINGESILGSGNITINGGSGGSGLAAPWSIDENFLGVWSKSSPNLSEDDFFAGLHINDGLVGFEATNLTSNKDAIIIPTLTSDIPLFQFMSLDGNIISMVKLPEDFFTRSQTINLGDIANSGGSGGSGSGRPHLYSHTITLKDSGNSAYFAFTIYVRTDEEVTKDTLFDYLNWNVCAGTGVVSNALIDKIDFSATASNTLVHQFLELSGQHIDENLTFDSVFGTDFTVEDVVRGPDWIPPR